MTNHCCVNYGNDRPLLCECWQMTRLFSHRDILQITLIVIFPPNPITLGSLLPFYVVVVIVCYQPEVEVECDVEECQGEKAEPENISLQKEIVYTSPCYFHTMLISMKLDAAKKTKTMPPPPKKKQKKQKQKKTGICVM